MFVDTTKPQVPASSSPLVHNFSVRPACRDNGDYSQDHGSAQYFHGIATDADIGNASPFPRRPDMHFARATALDALPNHHLLITFCDAVLDHPTGSAACRRSRGWIFATVKKHSCSSFEPAFAPFGAKKVEKVRACVPQEFRRLNVTELQIRERLSITEWHDREGQSCRDRLDRPFRRNFVNRDSDDARDVVSRKRSSEFS